VKLGLTLPTFREDPEPALAVAHAAEDAGLDGVFAFDHLFRRGPTGALRPALECTTLLGAIAAETSRLAFGPLVARATMRPPATLAAVLDTLARVAPGRLIATIGSGDRESREENERFGIGFGTMSGRVEQLAAAVDHVRGHGYPVWVGGESRAVRLLAADHADGWNRWGTTPDRFAHDAEEVRRATAGAPFTLSWGGLVILAATAAEAKRKADRLGPPPGVIVGGPERIAEVLRTYGEAGATWVIAGPVDSSDPDNAAVLGEAVKPRLA
jgi:alkanesulfonate monooxygenase SsuD/methylene tetrahydromethanopterin reductase-like flavin-dependent oxidoreductase (luciferase family)